ncbi:MAG: rhomboid family intramembrane serine protease [Planctomycetota bacterium]|nr:rhomboid family intramembrane serine protease [Planctomycetota bacterium]
MPVPSRWSGSVKAILGLYLGIYVLQFIVSAERFGSVQIERYVALSSAEILTGPWRILSFSFFHSLVDPFHFFIVFLSLAIVSPDLEKRLGRRVLIVLYLGSGLLSGILHLVFSAALPGYVPPAVQTLGASGVAYSLLFAYFWYLRDQEAFGLLRGKILAPILFLAVSLSGFQSHQTIAEHGVEVEYRTQLGGVLFSVGFIFLTPRWRRFVSRRKTSRQLRQIVMDNEIAARVDFLLEKIHQQGMGTLTRSERRFLRKASVRYRIDSSPEKAPPQSQG